MIKAILGLIRKNRLRSSMYFTVFYLLTCLLVFYFYKLPEDYYGWNFVLQWYCLAMMVIWHDKNPLKQMQDIYFPAALKEELQTDIIKQGFRLKEETASKILFIKEEKRWLNARMIIRKDKGNIWRVSARAEFLKDIEKYRLRYSHR